MLPSSKDLRHQLNAVARPLPLYGNPIQVELASALRSHRGELVFGQRAGTEVHAATFLRQRRIVLDRELLRNPKELRRIFMHELFHFAWLRLGNGLRRSYGDLVDQELRACAKGELGWSSEWRKQVLRGTDCKSRNRRWREYVCESFCDTAAWMFSGLREHPEFRLAKRWRNKRRRWFQTSRITKRISV